MDCLNESISPPYKRARKKRPLNKDRISKLPEELITDRILSLLPTEEAILTSILSKQWRNRWTKLPNLSFCFYTSGPKNDHYQNAMNDEELTKNSEDLARRFIDFISGALFLHDSPEIKSFKVGCKYLEEFEPWVSRWVRYLTMRNIQTLHLKFFGKLKTSWIYRTCDNHSFHRDLYMLPQFLYENVSIEDVSFTCCIVSPRASVYWSSLKRLVLFDTLIKEDVIRRVLLGSPQLEFLDLVNCKGFCVVDTICSISLRSLVISGFHNGGPKILHILGSDNLESFALLGDFFRTRCRLVNVLPPLNDVTLDFRVGPRVVKENLYVEYQYMLLELLDKTRNVEQLRMGNWCIEVLSMSKMKNVSSPFLSCKLLILDTLLREWELPGVVSLLEAAQNLEVLLVTSILMSDDQYEVVPRFTDSSNLEARYQGFEASRNSQLKRSLKRLKEVMVDDSTTLRYKDEHVYKFTDLLFRHLTLEKVTVTTHESERLPFKFFKMLHKSPYYI